MMPLCWYMLLLCLSVNAENIAKSGGKVTLECSYVGCRSSIEGYTAMYVYKDFQQEREEVLYHYKSGKVTPRPRYKDRIQKNGSLGQHTITISNLTVDDTGLYRCVYKKMESHEVLCDVYTLLVMGHQVNYPHPAVRLVPIRAEPSEGGVVCKPEELPQPLPSAPCALASEESPPLVLIIIVATVTITTLVTTTFIMLILPRMKQWISSRRRVLQDTNDNVYEVMTMNGLRPLAAPEPSPPSLCDFA